MLKISIFLKKNAIYKKEVKIRFLRYNLSKDKVIFSSLFKKAKSLLFRNLLSTNIIILNASLILVNCSSKLSKLILENFLPFAI